MKEVSFTLNGSPEVCVADDALVLLDYLRQEKGLTGTKQSCDRKGQCGACTVIVNKKAVRSCLTRVAKLSGADVITVEGMGTPDNPHLIQEAFALAGAVQCGFCTPGMIMATKVLLDDNPDPDTDAIKKALARNLCRCTGYAKIIDAVKLAGKFVRGEASPDQVRPDPAMGTIGVSLPRPTAMLMATGKALYSADIRMDGMLELAAVRSPHARAKIISIDTSKAEQLPGVVAVITAKDIRGTNRFRPDQPLLCEDMVHVMGDAVAAVVAETREQALGGVEAVVVQYEPLPAVSTVDEALSEGSPRVHESSPNLCFTHPQIKGDAQAALAGSHEVVETEFSTQLIHQSPLEPEASIAYLESEDDCEEPSSSSWGEASTFIITSRSSKMPSVGKTCATRRHTSAANSASRWT